MKHQGTKKEYGELVKKIWSMKLENPRYSRQLTEGEESQEGSHLRPDGCDGKIYSFVDDTDDRVVAGGGLVAVNN